jgi:hypothetical protein
MYTLRITIKIKVWEIPSQTRKHAAEFSEAVEVEGCTGY